MEKILEKHSKSGYIDRSQVDQSKSYYIQSKPRNLGGSYVYQFITMNDGTVYELSSMTASTKGIVANNCRDTNVLQRVVKNMCEGAIYY